MSYLSWFQGPNCETPGLICECARVIRTMRMLQTPNEAVRLPISSIFVCQVLLSEKELTKSRIHFTNIVYVSDVTEVIHGEFNTEYELVWITTVMFHSSRHLTAKLSAQILCTWLRYSTLLMVSFGKWGKEVGWGQMRESVYINEQLVKWLTCHKLAAESTGML